MANNKKSGKSKTIAPIKNMDRDAVKLGTGIDVMPMLKKVVKKIKGKIKGGEKK